MREITQPCKICGGIATARFDDDAPQDAVDKWIKLLTHDRCHDIRRKRVDSSEKLVAACFDYARATTTEKGKMIASTRSMITLHSRRFAESYAELYRMPRVMWSQDFVDLLIEKPESVGKILGNFQSKMRKAQEFGGAS